jgi:hypothetical protein
MVGQRSIFFAVIVWLIVAISVPVSAQASTIYVTTQRFERGMMIWRGDNSVIIVLGNNGQVSTFSPSEYNPLPDNPIVATPPNRLRPILGFGKVWGNHKAVRDLLGWATLPEIGFNSQLLVQNHTIFITELDKSVIQINSDGTWIRKNGTPPPQTCPYPLFFGGSDDSVCAQMPVTTTAAYQRYEHGFMVWLSHTGEIWVFYSEGSLWQQFAERDYAGFADAPPGQAPGGKIQPINGFGRVWHNFTSPNGQPIRTQLGWATAPELQYSATKQLWGRTAHVHTYLSVPNGQVIDMYSGLAGIRWLWVY